MPKAPRRKEAVTLSWPIGMKGFMDQVVFGETRVKLTQISETAMEDWLKKNNWWDQYQEYLMKDML